MYAKIKLVCCGADAHAEKTAPLVAGIDTPVKIELNRAFDGLTKRDFIAKCGSVTERITLENETDIVIPGRCLIGGEKLYLGIDARNRDFTRRIPSTWAGGWYVHQSTADIKIGEKENGRNHKC